MGKVRIGEEAAWDFSVRNTRSDAVVVDLRGRPPMRIEPGERFLLAPGEVRAVRISLTAAEPGPFAEYIGLQLEHDVKVIEVKGEAIEPCHPSCGYLADGRCQPHREGMTCSLETPCASAGLCAAGACVAEPLPDRTACESGCGEGSCLDGRCELGGVAAEPAWSFTRQGAFELGAQDGDRALLLARWTEAHASPFTIRSDGTLLTETHSVPVPQGRPVHLFEDAVAVWTSGAWRGYDLHTGAAIWPGQGIGGGREDAALRGLLLLLGGTTIRAIDPDYGVQRWSWSGRGSSGSMRTDDERLYFLGDGEVAAIDPATGATIWSWTPQGPAWGGIPDGTGGLVVAQHDRTVGAAETVHLDRRGIERWRRREEVVAGERYDHAIHVEHGAIFMQSGMVRSLDDGGRAYRVPVESLVPILAFAGPVANAWEVRCDDDCSGWLVGFRSADGAILYETSVPVGSPRLAPRADGHLVHWRGSTGNVQCVLDPEGDPLLGLDGARAGSGVGWLGEHWLTLRYDPQLQRSTLTGWHVPPAE